MKKKLLLFLVPVLLLASVTQAQIKYWDFGAKELGTGYDNMLPEFYLNAFANYLRQIDWVDGGGTPVTNFADGVAYAPKTGYENENGHSVESLWYLTFNANYADFANFHFTLSSKGSSPNPPNGTLLSGESLYTKPQMLPDLDGATNMVFYKDSNSDALMSINSNLTRYDERTGMPDAISGEFEGCIQFTTPGEKRYRSDGTRHRGFLMDLQANEYVTVVGAGQYTDIEGDQSLGCETGYLSFESYGGTGTPVYQEDFGTGKGAFDCSGLTGGDTGDEAPRVMEFQADGAQTYRLANRGGKIRIYRIYISSSSIKSQVEALLGVDDVASPVSTDLKAVGNRVYLSNVKLNTEINIYSITGSLVKSIKVDADTDFEFKSGLWIATLKTAEGQKSVKFVTK
ncbi:T9SS type A sorting domain-containing protein [Flavobacteriaceae bacterium SZ-1-7]|uniref:T9SS type A sorting domain-containing protein n=1 Tax=Tamlana sedimenti TaxID=3134126 RepID=UPI003128E9DA